MKTFAWLCILAAAASYNLGLGLPAEPEEPVIPALPTVEESEPAEESEAIEETVQESETEPVLPEEEPDEVPAPTACELYTEFYRTHFASVDPKTDWDNAAYHIALPDLDFNGVPEMVVEKAGASAAGTLEIYTIEEGEVRAFTSSALPIPSAKNAMDSIIEGDLGHSINLHEDGDGYAVYAESRNGAMDFERCTWYRFTSESGALACEAVTTYRADVTDWSDYAFDTAVWNGSEYTYEEFEPLWREWLTEFFQARPITDASWMDNLRTHTISDTDEAYALIAEICE